MVLSPVYPLALMALPIVALGIWVALEWLSQAERHRRQNRAERIRQSQRVMYPGKPKQLDVEYKFALMAARVAQNRRQVRTRLEALPA